MRNFGLKKSRSFSDEPYSVLTDDREFAVICAILLFVSGICIIFGGTYLALSYLSMAS